MRIPRTVRRALTRPFLLATGAALAAAPLLASPQALIGQDLPDAETLIARFVEASGGAERFSGQSSVTRGSLSLPAMGISGSYELVQIYPNRMRLDADLPGIGAIQSGFTGEVGWSVNPVMGPQLMEGDELVQMQEQASVAASLRGRSAIPERETVGEAEFEGQACWRVRLVWASGRESHDCFAKDTGLLLASEAVQSTPMGDVPSVSVYLDYQDFDGRMISTRMIQRVAGQEQVMTVSAVEFGDVDEARVAPPAAIRTLIGG